MKSSLPMDEGRKNTEGTTLLKQAFLAIQEMQSKLEAAERRAREPIAVVGIGCRFPGGVVDGETFWELLSKGRDAISHIPSDRWNADDYYDPDPDQPGKMVTRQGGFLDQVDGFDARFFEIAPREAASMDPQQRLALEVSWETLENAGYAPADLRGTKTGVFLGIASSDYSQLHLQTGDPDLLDAHYASGVAHSIASGRISYVLGLEGPSVSLDTACSSSLLAVHLACQSLRTGDCNLALAGGVNVMLAPETTALLSRVRMLSPDGRCKAFDESANGFVRGEGCGFVALKTLQQAQEDGDRILAVILGSAVNQDGASSSLTAPNGPSQESLLRHALANAGVLPDQVSYVEAHGTGTALGDPIELQALGAVYGASRLEGQPLLVGSLKTNIGHLEAAAGVAGLIKTVLAFEHRQIPAHLHLERPTSHVRWDALRLTVPQRLTNWETNETARIAAVSSFGFSGTNAHVVVAEASPVDIARSETGWPVQLLTVSAKSEAALKVLVEQYGKSLEQHPTPDLRDFCFTANIGRSHFSHRACFLASDAEQMKQQLAAFETSARPASTGDTRTCFLFTGQGSQYAGMGRELYASSPVFREALERCAAAWKEETGGSLMAVLYPEEGEAGGMSGDSRMKQARYAQPALFAFEYALAELWRSWGVEPGVLLGHSLGEYVAAVVAGVFSVEDGLRLVCARARLMDRLTLPGAMRSINASAERVRREIAGLEAEVAIAVVNGPESVVLSGVSETVARTAGKLEAEGIRTRPLEVTHAFHSPLLEPVLDEFEEGARQVKYHAPQIRMISNLTGKTARAEEIATPRYWREHMRQTVQFYDGLQAALETGCQTFLEIGPQPHLLTLGKLAHDNPDLLWLPSVRRGRNAWLDILSTIQTLYVRGAEINWKALHRKSGRPIVLPTYPFERQRHWFPRKAEMAPSFLSASAQKHPLLGSRLRSPLEDVQFESRIGPNQPTYLGDHVVGGRCVVPAAAYLEMALSGAKIAAAIKSEDTAGGPPAIKAVTFLRPCIFDESRILQCVFRNTQTGSSFAIHSCAASSSDNDADWILHATGEIGNDVVAPIPNKSSHVDMAGIRKRCAEELSSDAFYREFEEHGSCFGTNFRPVAHVFRGPGEALVEFEMPTEVKENADQYRIHPIALDGCFQSLAAALSVSAEDSATVYLPAALEELSMIGDVRNLALAHARLYRGDRGGNGGPMTANVPGDFVGDVVGFDLAGNVLLSARGMVLRPIRQEDRSAAAVDSISKSFYEVEWMPVETFAQSANEAASMGDMLGTCVVCGNRKDFIANLSEALEKNGTPCVTILHDKVCTGNGELQFSFDPSTPHCYDSVLHKITMQSPSPVSDFVYVAPFAVEDALRLRRDNLIDLEAETLEKCLRISQALLRMDSRPTPRLWIVTKGAQGPFLSNVVQSTLWGFGRAVAAEHSEMRVVRIDLDPSRDVNGEELLRCMQAVGLEDELVLRGREVYAPRLRPTAQLTAGPKSPSGSEESNVRLALMDSGTLDGIENVSANRQAPGPGEIEIRVYAAGLNFRDVLNVLGMYKGNAGPLGGECAGVVVRVGAGVDSFRPGDEVVALGQGCFARFLTTRAELTWAKPANLSFAAAVTIPVAFLTAKYALETIAHVQAGERVLIHAGAGGVGLAAIQIAQQAGAIVFATAGSAEKRAYLASIGVSHVMDSRSLEFVREIPEITDGQGVDVVLNSLVGQFIDAGIETLADGGRFVELGVADLRSTESVASLRPDVAYLPFNLAQALEPGEGFVREILTAIFDEFESGALQPLPREIFSMEKARDAFRYMAQARHIGRVVLCPAQETERDSIRKDGAYLVTGGLSGIGLAVAEWLGQRGAGQVIVMGRSLPTTDAANVFDRMRNAGTVVSVWQGDVSKEADVIAALVCADGFPLRGVFHCAGVLDDGALLLQDWQRFQRVLSPKLEGTCNLHRLTANSPLDHFVLFSSVASVLGSPGQTNYAAANSFLDAMAQYRRSRGLPALSIDWGAWSETGAAVRHHVGQRGSKIGLGGISTHDGLQALEMSMADTRAQVMVASVDWKTYFANEGAPSNPHIANQQLLSELRTARQQVRTTAAVSQKKDPSSKQSGPSWLPQLEQAVPVQRQHLLMHLVEERIQTTLGLSVAQQIDPNQPLQELGLDSLLSIELRNSLSACLGRSLPATLSFNYPTLNTLTGFILRDVLVAAQPKSIGPKVDSSQTRLVDDIEALSDEEVDRLLSARAMGGGQ